MKKQKLNLNTLKVESFVTDLEKGNSQTVKGGTASGITANITCNWHVVSLANAGASICKCL